MLRIYKFLVVVFLTSSSVCVADARANETRGLRDRIRHVESIEGQYSSALYGPLRRLGLALLEEGSAEQAVDVFRRMQNLVHRSHGVYSPVQQESIELLIEAHLRLGEFDVADTQHRFLHSVAERNYEPDSVAMRKARWRLANWYRNTGRYDRASSLYEETRKQIESVPELVSEMVMLLRAEALTMYMAGRCCASEKLERALALSEQSADFDTQDRQHLALEYADMLMMERKSRRAGSVYATSVGQAVEDTVPRFLGLYSPRKVVEIIDSIHVGSNAMAEVHYLAQEETEDESLPTVIGFPVTVCSSPIAHMSQDDVAEFYIDVELEVDETGRARQVELDGEAPFTLFRYFRTVLLKSRYRPQIDENGNLTRGKLAFRERFGVDEGPRAFDDVGAWSAMMVSHACSAHGGGRGT